MLDPYVEYQKETRRSIVNKELMMLYGHDVNGYLPPLPDSGRQKSCIVDAWSCGNPAMRQLGSYKKRGPRNTDLHAAFHQRRPAPVGRQPERPHTAVTEHVRSVLNTKWEDVQRPHTSAGQLESLPFSKKLAPIDDPEGLIVPPKLTLPSPTDTDSQEGLEVASLPAGGWGGLRKPRPGRPGGKRKKSAKVRETGFPNLDQRWSEDIKRVLAGDMEDLPADVPNTVKIYISGTAQDFQAERLALQSTAYPALREQCQLQGIDLEMVDLEWGVIGGDTTVDPQLRLRELHRCQTESVGPYMVVFLGDRYGPCIPPPEIPSTEFGKIRSMAVDNRLRGSQLIEEYYVEDTNPVPSRYIFQHEKAITDEDSTQLSHVLNEASGIMVQINKMTPERQQYFSPVSATERDLRDTITKLSSQPYTKILCFTRRFKGLPADALKDPSSAIYTDVNQDGLQPTVDTALQSKLESLYDFIQNQVGETAMNNYEIPWNNNGVISSDEDHKCYLDQICKDFAEGVKNLIDLNRKHTTVKHKNYPLFKEVVQHSYQCARHCGMFAGREELLSQVEGYMKDDSRNCKPLVIHGETGVGKSALMSAVAKHCKDWLGPATLPLVRYSNSTEQSSDVCSLLYGVCHQMAAVYNLDMPSRSEVNRSPSKLVQVLHTQIEQVAKHHGEQRPLVILLDDVDRLSNSDRADTLHWLPQNCPKNVYIIVSVHSKSTQILSRLRKRIPLPGNFVQVDELADRDVQLVLDSILAYHDWSLTTSQREALVAKCHVTPNPLFVFTMAAHALHWHSWTNVIKGALPTQLEDAVMKHIFNLEDAFGSKLVDCTLECLSLFEHGISLAELKDAASSDEQVLKEVFRLHRPKDENVIQVLSSVLSSLVHSLGSLLRTKRMHGTVLYSWRFESCRRFSLQKCFKCEDTNKFLDVDNPAMLNRLQKLLSLFTQESGIKTKLRFGRKVEPKNVDSQVRPQPTIPNNLRKLHLLPQLVCGTDVEDVKKGALKKDCLCNFDWLLIKLTGMGVDEVLADYKLYERRNREVDLVKDFLLLCRDALSLDPASLAQQMVGCLPSLDEEVYPLVDEMMQKALRWSEEMESPILVPVFPCFPSPLDATKAKAWGVSDIFSFDESGRLAVVRNKDGFTEIWDMENYERCFALGIKLDKVTRNIYASDQRILGVEGPNLKIWEIESGILEVNLDLRQFIGKKISSLAIFCFSQHFDLVTLLTSDEDFNQSVLVVDTNTKDLTYKVDKFDVKDEFFKESAAFARQSSMLVFVNARSQVLDDDTTVDMVKLNIHDLASKKKLHILPCGENKLHKLMLKDDKIAVLGWQDCSFDIYDVTDGSLRWRLSAPDAHLHTQGFHFTEDDYMVALTTTTKDATRSQWAIWFWNIEENASGQLLCEPYANQEEEPHHFLVLERLHVVVVGVPGTARLDVWDLPTATCISNYQAHTDGVDTLVKCPQDHHRFYSCSIGEGVTKLWDLYSTLSDFKHGRRSSTKVRRESSASTEFRHRASSVLSSSGLSGILRRPGSRSRSSSAKSVRFSAHEEPISIEEGGVAENSNEPIMSQQAAAVGVVWVSLSKDDKYVVCGSEQRMPTVWDLDRGQVVVSMERQTGLDIGTPWVELADQDRLVVGLSIDAGSRESYPYMYRYQVWDRSTGKSLFADAENIIVATACTLSDDKERAILSCIEDTTGQEHSDPALTFKVIQIASNTIQQQVTYATGVVPLSLALTADGQLAITRSTPPPPARTETFTVFLLENLGESQPKPVAYKYEKGNKYKEYRATGNVLLPNGIAVATGVNGDLQIWDITNGEYEGNLCEDPSVKETRNPSLHNHGGKRIQQMAVSADGRYMVCGAADCTASLWDLEKEVRVHTYRGHTLEVCAVCISSDNELVLTASADNTVCVWSFGATEKPLCRLYTHLPVKTLHITNNKQTVLMLGAHRNQPSEVMMFRLKNAKQTD